MTLDKLGKANEIQENIKETTKFKNALENISDFEFYIYSYEELSSEMTSEKYNLEFNKGLKQVIFDYTQKKINELITKFYAL